MNGEKSHGGRWRPNAGTQHCPVPQVSPRSQSTKWCPVTHLISPKTSQGTASRGDWSTPQLTLICQWSAWTHWGVGGHLQLPTCASHLQGQCSDPLYSSREMGSNPRPINTEMGSNPSFWKEWPRRRAARTDRTQAKECVLLWS